MIRVFIYLAALVLFVSCENDSKSTAETDDKHQDSVNEFTDFTEDDYFEYGSPDIDTSDDDEVAIEPGREGGSCFEDNSCLGELVCKNDICVEVDGEIRWKLRLDGDMTDMLSISMDGTIYVPAQDRFLHAVNPDGTLKWTFEADGHGGDPLYAVIADDGTIYFGFEEFLYAVNPDGTEKWRKQIEDFSDSPSLSPDGTLYLAGKEGLYAINPDGTEKWLYETEEPVNDYPTVMSDGTVLFSINRNECVAVDSEGNELWSADHVSAPSIYNDDTFYVLEGKSLVKFNSLGVDIWEYEESSFVFSQPIIDSDGVVYFSGRGFVTAVNSDGTLKWRFDTVEGIYPPILCNDGTLYTMSDYGYLRAINPDGTEKWKIWIKDASAAYISMGLDGTLYYGAYDGNLYAIDTDCEGLMESAWPAMGQNMRRTNLQK